MPVSPAVVADLRSDTVTVPDAAMRRAMADAEVGDDVYGEDPTASRLEARVAEIAGKEAALFVPSGVMSNQLALKVHTSAGDEALVERGAHVLNYESGGAGLLSGVTLLALDDPRGRGHLTADVLASGLRSGTYYWEARQRVAWFENTANRAGGTVQPPGETAEAAEAARAAGLALHLDGARLWNASVALGLPVDVLAAPFDTVSLCLSKGLGAPVGSVLAGPRDLIREAHRYRKMWGGGMRQVGVIAAAGLHALDHHRSGLAADHARARALADACAAAGLAVVPPETNIVMADTPGPAADAASALAALGVRVSVFGPRRLRLTTHRDVGDEAIAAACEAIARVFGGG